LWTAASVLIAPLDRQLVSLRHQVKDPTSLVTATAPAELIPQARTIEAPSVAHVRWDHPDGPDEDDSMAARIAPGAGLTPD